MKRLLLLCLPAIGALYQPALARDTAIMDGNDLLTQCTNDPTYCMGYVLGVYRGFSVGQSLADKSYVCLPENVTVDQARRVVVAYLNTHPKELNKASELLVTFAMMDAFPCKSK